MRDRLKQASDSKQCGYEDIQIGTFHAVSSRFLKKKGIPVLLADEGLKEELAGEAMKQAGLKGSPGRFLRDLSRVKNGMTEPESEEGKKTETDKRMEARVLYQKAMKEQAGEDPLRREGYRDGTWVLLDYGCVVVHVFSAEAREFYSLERLWHDGKPVDLSGVLTEN